MTPQKYSLNGPNPSLNDQPVENWWQNSPANLASGQSNASAFKASTLVDKSVSASLSELTTPILAADKDLIEDEWVKSAKKIIETYRTDPYQQSRVMTALRHDYLQKRYGKTIKTSES